MEPNPAAAPSLGSTSVLATPDRDVEENKDLAAFSYVWIFSLLMLVSYWKSPFVRFHARQGAALFLFSVAVWFVPYAGKFLELLVLFGMAWGFIHAAHGKREEVPFIGPLSRGRLSFRSSLKQTVVGIVQGVDSAKELWKQTEAKQPSMPPPPSPAAFVKPMTPLPPNPPPAEPIAEAVAPSPPKPPEGGPTL